jgi:large subunit ribosomal protein L10
VNCEKPCRRRKLREHDRSVSVFVFSAFNIGIFVFMAISRQKKEEIVEKVKAVIKSAVSIVFVNFHGMTVADTSAMRKKMREEGVGYTVAKKTLVRRSFEDSDIKGEIPSLDGEIALAYGDDLIAPARNIQEFGKQYKSKLTILGGVFEGAYLTASEMIEIATIPPLQTLRGMFVNVINSPIQGLAVALNAIADKKS